MKKKNSNYKIVFLFIGIIVFVALLYFGLNKDANITLTALKDIIYKPFVSSTNNREDLISINLNSEIKDENKELKNLINIEKTLTDFKNINAVVIERNHSYWLDSMTINKGKKDGIDIGMAVVVSEGLVGKITSITYNTSTVKLITSNDNKNKISVKFKYGDSYVYKVLNSDGDKLIISGIDNNLDVNKNAVVLTSGLSDIYPSGIIIGTVDKVESDKYGVSKKAYVSSKVDFDNLRFVSVLERIA